MPGIIKAYPIKEKGPGIICTPVICKKNVDMDGYKDIARLGTIGSGNNFETITEEMMSPIHKIIDMYKKPAKCFWDNKLSIP